MQKPIQAVLVALPVLIFSVWQVLAIDSRVAELDRYDAELQKMIAHFRATHTTGTPLPPELIQMQEQIRQQRAALASGTAVPSSGGIQQGTSPALKGTTPATAPGLNGRQQAVLQGFQQIGNVFQDFLQQQEQEKLLREQEEERRELLEQQRAATQNQASSLQFQMERLKQMDYDRANLPQDIDERYTALVILANRYPQRYDSLLKETEAEVKRLPARPMFKESLASFYGSTSSSSGTTDSGTARWAPAGGGSGVSKRVNLADIVQPEDFENDGTSPSLKIAGRGLKKIRDDVINDAVERGNENSLGFSRVYKSWWDYTETTSENAAEKGNNLNKWNWDSIKNAGQKVKDSWRQFLDEDALKDLKDFKGN